ncbi:hypothetical protein DFH06DRAFT_1120408 [Mycena polygramma]|nr:hypothetical protein DFH06DRAFT_1120408 [Mycena polygramma]
MPASRTPKFANTETVTPTTMPQTPTKTRKPRSAPSTPSKKKKSKPDPEPESQCRASTIDPNQTIINNKSAIKSHYRLDLPKDSDLKPTKLYKERDIEYVAWKKHGGPARFETYLAGLQEAHERKNTGKPFNKPAAYGGEWAAPSPTLPLVLVDRRAPDPYLIHVKQQLVDMGQGWLWEAANRGTPHLYMKEGSPSLLMIACSYPRRPETSQILFSDSFTRLINVLERGGDESMQCENGCKGYKYWDEHYLEVLFEALITVIRVHGEDGWKSARWEVYDTYSGCFPGYKLQYKNNTWSDQAKDWLQGKMVLLDRHIITTRRDNAVELGRVYNEMLPTISY